MLSYGKRCKQHEYFWLDVIVGQHNSFAQVPILVAKEQERLHKRRKFNLQFIVGQIFIVLEILFSLVFEALFFEFEGSIKLLHI